MLRADKSYFFSEGERAFLAYRVVGGVAIVSGDPIGPPEELDAPSSTASSTFVRSRGWRLAILGVSETCLYALPPRTVCGRCTTATRPCSTSARF